MDSAACSRCGTPGEEARRMVDVGGPPLCEACIRGYQEGLSELLRKESLAMAALSPSAEAEEMALGLFEALETSRAESAAGDPELALETRQAALRIALESEEASRAASGARAEPDAGADPAHPGALWTDQQREPPAPSLAEGASPAPRSAPPAPPLAVIPARYGSTRFPGKALAPLGGKPLVQHVWERCLESGAFSEVVIATDDARIAEAARAFGATVAMTSEHCRSGTDRVAEVLRSRPEIERVVNVQGDEPFVSAALLRSLASAFEDPGVSIATPVRPLEEHERGDPNVVKVALGRAMDALYFSRADIPFARDPGAGFPPRYAHLGLYAYRREALLALAQLPGSPLEETEKLEQLRALECGMKIRCVLTLQDSVGVDTPEDLARAEARFAAALTAQPQPGEAEVSEERSASGSVTGA